MKLRHSLGVWQILLALLLWVTITPPAAHGAIVVTRSTDPEFGSFGLTVNVSTYYLGCSPRGCYGAPELMVAIGSNGSLSNDIVYGYSDNNIGIITRPNPFRISDPPYFFSYSELRVDQSVSYQGPSTVNAGINYIYSVDPITNLISSVMFDLQYNGTQTINYTNIIPDFFKGPPYNYDYTTIYSHTYTNTPVVTFLSVTQDDGARGDSSFTTQPVARTVTLGQSVTFSVVAETFDGSEPAYQWLKDGVVIPGATTSTLVLPTVVASQIGDYSVRIQGEAGPVFSQAAALRLEDAPSGPWRSLVACYPFDGSPVDVCRPTQPAELVNAVQLVTDPGRGMVADIDGRGFGIPPFPWETPASQGPGGFIRIPRPVAAAGESFTISFWIKEKGYSSWHGEAFLTMGEGVDSIDLLGRYWVNSLGGATEFYGSQSSVVEGVWPARAVVDAEGVAVVTEPWTAWTLVAEGSDVKVYREGTYRGRVPYALGTKGDFVIGSHGWLDGVPRYSTRLRALIDDVRIFNRALTAPEILQLHATSQPVPGPDAFVAWTAEYGLNGNEAAFTADPDGDELTNLQEYCFGTPPVAYTGTSSRFQTSSTGSTLDWWGRSDVTYEVQTSIDLVQWTTSSFPAAPAPEQVGVPAGYQRFQVELPVLDPNDRINLYAMRVQAVSPPFFNAGGTLNMTPPNGEPVLGGSVVLSAPMATGSALAYQWYKDGVPLAGAIQSRLEIARATTADTGNYELAVTNAAGTTRSHKTFLRPTTESIPEVSTGVATGVTATGAEVAAVVTGDGGAFVSERGVVYAMTPNPTLAPTPTLTSSAKLAAGTGTGPFRVALTALASRSTYFLRAYAVNGHGTAYGEEVVLTTLAPPVALAAVSTGAVSDITSTTLSVSGVVTDGGSSPVTVRGVVYGLTTEPTTVTGTAVATGAGTGVFTVGLTRLQPVTPYYVRAFATNAMGTSYGATVSVTTLAVPVVLPQVTTSAVTGLTPLSATAGGEVVQDGGAVVTARGVVYGASPAPTLSTGTMVSAGGGTGTFSAALSGLMASSTYYLRAFATNSAGTAYGEEISFTTAAVSTGFVPVHADSFVQGSPESEAGRFTDEGPQFTATLTTGIHLKQTEITWNEWSAVRALAGAYGFTDMAAGRNGGDGDASGTHPVTMVSWWDVVKWCNLKSLIEGRRPAYYTAADLNAGAVFKVGTLEVFVDWSAPSYRLPTEAEWEFSCRAGSTGPVYGELSQIAWYAENSGDGTHPAGQLLANNWGLQDMMGNVWEWCWDWKPVYDGSPQTDPRGAASGTDRVMRGGCFHNAASVCRSAYRNVGGFPGGRSPFIGFRPVLNVAPTLINPFIVAQPAALSLIEGQSLTLTVRAIGSPLTYQWVRNGVALTGATAQSLNILAVEAGEGGAYTVVVSSPTGSTTSQPAAVVVAGAADSTHVRVSSGDFVLGSPADEAGRLSEEGPTSEVTLTRSFRLKKTEVTWAEWSGVRELAAQYGYTDLSVGRNGSQGDSSGAHPVTEVSWWDAVKWCNLKSERSGLKPAYYTLAYLSTLPDLSVSTILRTGTPPVHVDWAASGYRLPTEAEWEYACRAGTTGAYAGPVDTLAWYYDNSLRNTHAVGQLQANALGLHDMHGNVWEWCWDDFAAYTAIPKSDPRTTVSNLQPRVVRGGSWGGSASTCRSASRGYQYADYSINDQGFRTLLPVASQAGVKTAEAAEVTATTALLGGTVTPSPTDIVSAFGVVFATTPNPSLATGTVLPATTPLGSFSIVASGLLHGTQFFARAYATTSSGTDYGAEITFKTASATPTGFSLIPAGPFQMGDALDGIADAPVRTVNVSAFYMAQRETTKALWDEVRAWGLSRGYTDLQDGNGRAANHPVHTVSWFDIIKWCNARSEKEGLAPCYTVGGSPLRTGTAIPVVNWTAKGYRLPTEAEWEKSARGGLNGKRFPLGDTITHSQANYWSDSSLFYDVSLTRGGHPTYTVGGFPYTSPVGNFAANGYGLHDMEGNLWEWCWDWYGNYDTGSPSDPRGASSGSLRVRRGGVWTIALAIYCRVANRSNDAPSSSNNYIGFRVVRSYTSPVGQFVPTVITVAAVAGSTFDTFTINGEVTNDDSTLVTRRGVVYGLTAAPTLGAATDAPATSTGRGPFSSILTGLSPETTYYARAYATSKGGTAYGTDITFKTASSTHFGFALIPAGEFQMGDALDGMGDAPVRTVNVSAFCMAQRETTKALWDEVRDWGVSRGYTDLSVGAGIAANHPVHTVTWFDIVKWCNARSEKEGLTPCYTVGGSPLRTGTAIPVVNWTAKGYRLPTEAEWEKSARGGLNGKRFPLGDTITHSQANYVSDSAYAYDISPTRGYHPTYAVGGFPDTSPVAIFAANGYGLHDMAGNVWEWCWDSYGIYVTGSPSDPHGGSSDSYRVIRGGGWDGGAIDCRVANRNYSNPYFAVRINYGPSATFNYIGFRVVRSYTSPVGQFVPTVITGTSVAGATFDTFTVSGDVTKNGGTPITRRGVVYGLTPTPTLGAVMDAAATGADTGAFSSILTGLSPETIYYARAYATSALGTGYGADITFRTAPAIPAGFTLIPAGSFQMGDALDGMGDAPVRTVNVSAFYMAQRETTRALWDEVSAWGASRGYTDLPVSGGNASNHPVGGVNWFDIIRWCNARSEMEGLAPAYYMDDSQTAIYKNGDVDVTNNQVKWTATGYRLPTEAEWEKAARGALAGKRFPWGDTISHNQANYNSHSAYDYDISSTRGFHPSYSSTGTSPVGSFATNGYGLNDMAGNVWEWCWDWNGDYASGEQTDPKGSALGVVRILRGGGLDSDAINCRVTVRGKLYPQTRQGGFRLARGK